MLEKCRDEPEVAMRSSFLGMAGGVAAVLAVTSANAGEREITTQEVEAFFQQVQEEATEIMQVQELDRMVEWIDENFADSAVLQASMNVVHGDDQKAFVAIKFDKEDILRMGGMFAGPFAQMGFEDFSLEVHVFDMIPHGPDAATVTTRWTERFTLALPSMSEGAEAEARSVSVEEIADCTQLVQRNDERLQMGLMTCTGEVRF